MAPGLCYELWTAATDLRMNEQRQPEIADADLTPMALDIAAFGETNIMELPWLTPPPDSSVREAQEELRLLHAISTDGHITPLGKRMAALPCREVISTAPSPQATTRPVLVRPRICPGVPLPDTTRVS